MNIGVFGSGYVGLVQAAVLADAGHRVVCMDVDAGRVRGLEKGRVPFYEPGLERVMREGLDSRRLSFTNSADVIVNAAEYLFIAVGTPPMEDGAADLRQVLQVADCIGERMAGRKLVIIKSTVPVGTADEVRRRIAERLKQRGAEIEFDVVSNPEFLKEGSALNDAARPDRILIGADSPRAVEEMYRMYRAYNRTRDKIIVMTPRSAELAKYAANAMLAAKISFMNEMAGIAEALGADIEQVRRGIGSDPRIGYQFMYPGAGFGGSCFAKDLRALQAMAAAGGAPAPMVDAVQEVNQRQKSKLAKRVLSCLGPDLSGCAVAVWGLAFKPNTDDLREAPALRLLETLWANGASVRAYDPQAGASARAMFGERDDLSLCEFKEEALRGADCLVICTEWKAFFSPDFKQIAELLKRPLIIDGRNLYDPDYVASCGIEYYGIGRGLSVRRND